MSKDCPFCYPDERRLIFANPVVLGLWDGFPVSPGHALVVPRRHVASWFDATREEQFALLEGISRAKEEICRQHQPDGFNIGVNVNEAAGQTVFHLHVHVIPRYRGDVRNPRGGVRHVIPHKGDYGVPISGGLDLLAGPPHQRPLVRGDRDPLLPHLLADLDRAIAVDMAVAFVVRSGVRLVEEHLRDLLARGGKVRFLTGDYLDVTEPEALLQLLDLEGAMELRVFEAKELSFHPKAFILRFPDGSGTAYVGSSNLTDTALRTGVEWNYRIVTSADRAGFGDVVEAFESLYRHQATRAVDPGWVQSYSQRRHPTRSIDLAVMMKPAEPPPAPHEIQSEALAALQETRRLGNTAGLVVLATGLGKTWLAAFDTNRSEFKRILFVAHREEILAQAIRTFRRIQPSANIGRYDGANRQLNADLVFASVMTLGRLRHLDRFPKDHFDYIVVDEFHHAAARTYRNLIDYFAPKFLLGLTATPERTDGGDLLALCQENLVYRRDVFDGINQGLLCPFRYFGVPDEVNYANIPWRSSRFDEEALTAAVATQERAQNALEQHGRLGQQRTLAFCCSQRHAEFMADYFNQHGVRSVAVHSGPGSAPRAASLDQLGAGKLKVVFAVDMFNEGVDVPNIDTVLMLRPTESGILWQQQFGRGLRKAEGKSHLTVIDYIGNHRIFLTKVRTLFALGPGDREIERVLNLLVKDRAGLPPGCEATYDLEVIKIIRSLLRRLSPAEAFKSYYLDFQERNGTRPTAVEAFHDQRIPNALRPEYGSWLRFVNSMGGLSKTQAATLQEHGHFLDALEATPMTKSFKMQVLLALLNRDLFPGEIDIGNLTKDFRVLLERSAVLRTEAGQDLVDDRRLQALIESNPINAWVKGQGMGERQYFGYKDGIFRTTFAVRSEHRQALQELVREIVDWRLAQYLARLRQAEPDPQAPRGFVCKVSHAQGRPILFLPDRTTHPWLPSGWTRIRTEDADFEANFVKVALNVVRKAGTYTGENALPDLLRKWFGPDAGKPGTNFEVALERKGDAWEMKPLRPPKPIDECGNP